MRKLHPYRLPLKNGTWREGVIVQVDDRFGDVCPLPGLSRETLVEAVEETRRFLPLFPNGKPKLPSVQFAFDCLHHSIAQKMSVHVNALNELRPGFSCLKLKVGSLSLEETTAQIHSVPEHISLRLDFNRQWPLEKLFRLTELFPKERFDYFEEPTRLWSDVLSFSMKTEFPVALDESIQEFPFEDLPTLEALVVKPTILGFVPRCNVRVVISSAYESGVGVLHLARLSLLQAPNEVHGLDPYSMVEKDVLTQKPVVEAGRFKWCYSGSVMPVFNRQ